MTTPVVQDLVSVIIPVRNRAQWLQEAADSVLLQTHPLVEVLVCDDGSTDGTERAADEMAACHPEKIRVLHLPPRGAGAAREAGRLAARGEFIQYLDSDDLLLPEKFRLQIAALRARPDCEIAYGITRLVDEQGRILEDPYKWSGREIPHLFPSLLVDRWWNTHTPLYCRSICDRIGSWSDLRYSQDWEYDARAGALNVKLAFVNQPVCHMRKHSGQRQTGKYWLTPTDQLRFFNTLFRCALAAGVDESAPEMRHFARWVFAKARQAAQLGESAVAADLLSLAEEAAPSMTSFRRYRRWSQLLGWRRVAVASEWLRRATRRPFSHDTMRQSWMGPAESEQKT
ncbi:MAG: glycosyltransferase family 2 protein [Kiritimatiellia bacterium]|jgi:glycosyltransferase involved in cell wall biosynthesis